MGAVELELSMLDFLFLYVAPFFFAPLVVASSFCLCFNSQCMVAYFAFAPFIFFMLTDDSGHSKGWFSIS